MCVFEQGFFYKMDGIKKYSKEWFTLKATQADKADVKKLAQGIKSGSGEDTVFNASVFIGSKECLEKKMEYFNDGLVTEEKMKKNLRSY